MVKSPISKALPVIGTLLLIGQLSACAQYDGERTTSRVFETTGVPTEAGKASVDRHSRVSEGLQVDVTGLGAMILH